MPQQSKAIGVFLIENHRSMLWGLERLIEVSAPELELLGSCTSCTEAIERVQIARPDVIVFSIDAGNDDGVDAIPRLIAASGARVLVLSSVRDVSVHDLAVLSGAQGVVDKGARAETIVTAIKKIHEGQLWLDHAAIARIFVEFSRRSTPRPHATDRERAKIANLTPREREVILWLLAQPDASAKTVASKMNISEQTLRNHLSAIYEKLDVNNRLALYVYAQRNGLAEPSPKDTPT